MRRGFCDYDGGERDVLSGRLCLWVKLVGIALPVCMLEPHTSQAAGNADQGGVPRI